MSVRTFGPATLVALIALPLALQVPAALLVVPLLEQAVAQQCRDNIWPEHQHQAHIAYCAQEGYPTK